MTGTYLPGLFAYKILLGEVGSCWPETSPTSHLHGIIPEISQPELNYLCTTTSPCKPDISGVPQTAGLAGFPSNTLEEELSAHWSCS